MSLEFQLVLKTTLILAIAGALSLILRRASAASRYATWAISLLAVLAFPLAAALLPRIDVPILPESCSYCPAKAEVQHELAGSQVERGAVLYSYKELLGIPAGETSAVPAVESSSWLRQRWGILLWAAGAAVVFGRWLFAIGRLRRIRRQSVTLEGEDGWSELLREVRQEISLSKQIDLRMASQAVPPMTWGIFRHVILVPASAEEWSYERRRMVLQHEIAHIKRRDGLGLALSQIVCSVYWFNPLVWYAASRLHAECERACDDAVLRLGVDASDYADHLVNIARGLNSGFAQSAVFMAQPSQLKARVLAILDSRIRRRRLSHLAATVLLGIIGLLTVSAAAVRVTAAMSLVLPESVRMIVPSWIPATESQAPNTPGADAPVSIEGRVVRAGSTEPVGGARLILNADPVSDVPLTLLADDNGRFEFRGVPPGKYQLLSTREGYMRGVFGQRGPNGPGAVIEVAANESVRSVVLAMTPLGAISGQVRNRYGEPAGNVAIRAHRRIFDDGRDTLQLVQTARTNDLGEYRLYYLEPGQYFVSALPFEGPVPVAGGNLGVARVALLPGSPTSGPGGVGPGTTILTGLNNLLSSGFVFSGNTGETYVPVYFPGVADSATAKAIDVIPGATFNTADFLVSEVRAVNIRGRITNGVTGQPVSEATVVLMQGTGLSLVERFGGSSDKGTFEFRGIPPGTYELFVTAGSLPANGFYTSKVAPGGAFIDRTAVTALAANAQDTRLGARVPVSVGNADIDNLSVTVRPGFSIKGRITIEGRSSTEMETMLSGMAIQLGPAAPEAPNNGSNEMRAKRSRTFSMAATVSSDGTFSLNGVFPGVYQIALRGAANLPADAYVKSARLGAVDVINPRLVVAESTQESLEILIGTNPGTLQAAVVDAKQGAAKFVTVVLVPDSNRRQRFEQYFRAVTDASGIARVSGIAPGDYHAFAWEVIENGAWWDPEFLKKYEGLGVAVRIAAGGNQSINLKSIAN